MKNTLNTTKNLSQEEEKMSKNKIFIGILLLIGLVFAGCSSNEDGVRTGGIPSIGGGSSNSGNGVTLEFGEAMNNIQPQKGQPFSMILNIKNYQRHEIDNLEIRVLGFDTGYLNTPLDRDESLGPATDSGPVIKALIYENVVLDGFEGDYNWNPVFKYCYGARTQFREQLCIPNKLGQTCENEVGSNIFSNGPLGIKIESIFPIGESEIGIEIVVSDTLSGNVVNECFEDTNINPFGSLSNPPTVSLGSQEGDCVPTSSDDYVITNDILKYRCDFSRNSDEPYTSQITVEMDYNYQQEIRKKIVVRDLEYGR